MANDHYDKNHCKVTLCGILAKRGWEIHGFKEDRSDAMTDYFEPATWYGYALKDGYLLAASAYDSGKEITKREARMGNCSVCHGTGARLDDGPMVRNLLPGVGLSEPYREYSQGDPCEYCKATGQREEWHSEVIGKHPVFPGPSKGMSLCLSKDGKVRQEFRLWSWESNDYGAKKGHNEREAAALADRIESCTKDRPLAGPVLYEACLTGAIIRRNVAKGGLEVAFPKKPDPSTLAALKSEGFRWSSMAKVWWIRYSDHAHRAACRILGLPEPAGTVAADSEGRSWDDDPALLGGTCVL